MKALATRAAKIVPHIRIVAWDICITPNGPEIIEGNESFGSVIMQVFCSHTDEGLKDRYIQYLSECSTDQ